MGLTLTQRVIKANYELPEDEYAATIETYDSGAHAVMLVGASVSMPLGGGEQTPTISLTVADDDNSGRAFEGDWAHRRETYDLAREALSATVRANRGSREGLPLRSQRMLALGWDAWRSEMAQGAAAAVATLASTPAPAAPAVDDTESNVAEPETFEDTPDAVAAR